MADMSTLIAEQSVALAPLYYHMLLQALGEGAPQVYYTVNTDVMAGPAMIDLDETGNSLMVEFSASMWMLLNDLFAGIVLDLKGPALDVRWNYDKRLRRIREIEAGLAADSEAEAKIAKLHMASSMWIAAHEASHYKRGHLHWLRKQDQSVDKLNLSNMDYLAIELDADMRATERTFELFSDGDNDPAEALRWLERIVVAASCVIYLWMKQGRESPQYPPTAIRIISLFGFLRQSKYILASIFGGDEAFGDEQSVQYALRVQSVVFGCAKRLGMQPVERLIHKLRTGNGTAFGAPNVEDMFGHIRKMESQWLAARGP
jgi:hypothetical protein